MHLHEFIRQSIVPGSAVHTDGFPAYTGLEPLGFQHQATVLLGRGEDAASRLLPRVHRSASLLKRWLLGTHQGAVSNKHLPYYLDEFTFRFNGRTSRSRRTLFYRLLQQAVQVGPHTYDRLIQRPADGPNHTWRAASRAAWTAGIAGCPVPLTIDIHDRVLRFSARM